jgi:ParB family protein of integrating conjugative element (PFGI_1 class)
MSKIKLGADALKQAIATQAAQQMKAPLAEARFEDFQHANASINLRVDEVIRYEHDPRTQRNEKYEDIKASILARGVEQAMYVTKRPGSSQWMMAKGGNTRLEILQDLAKNSGDSKWLRFDFLIKAYTKESELLASHLIENIQRSDMTFWDTAKGLMLMRDEMEKEQSQKMPTKLLVGKLKSEGLDFQEITLTNYEFAVDYFRTLGDLAQKIALNDIRHQLRPQFISLSGISAKAADGDTEGFTTLYRIWVENYPTEHKTYECSSLVKHIHSNACRFLDVGEEELTLMVEGFKRNPKATFSELRTPPPPAATPDFLPPSDDNTDGLDSDDGSGSAGGAFDSGRDQGLANLTARLGGSGGSPFQASEGQGASSSTKGLKVASGLTPKVYNPAAPAEGGDGFGSDDSQPPLGGMSNLESALEQLQASLHEFADTAGISGQLLPAPGMPFGFYMEMPKPGVLGTSEELPLQAWWFLANLSGQVESDIDATLNLADLDGNLALPDTGAGGFRQALADDAQWALAVEQRLGGEPLIAASSIFNIVTDAQHPLCEPAMNLIAHIRTLRLYQAEAAGATR